MFELLKKFFKFLNIHEGFTCFYFLPDYLQPNCVKQFSRNFLFLGCRESFFTPEAFDFFLIRAERSQWNLMSVSDRKDFYRTYSLIIFQKMRINSIACLNATRHSQSRILSFKRSVKINCREIFSRSISFSRTFAVLPAQSSFTLKLKLWGSFKRFSVEKYTQSSFKNLENSFQHKIINFKPSSTKWKAGKRLWCDENTLALLSLIV